VLPANVGDAVIRGEGTASVGANEALDRVGSLEGMTLASEEMTLVNVVTKPRKCE
jgi:hypothetical protein